MVARDQVLSIPANNRCWLCFSRIMEMAFQDSRQHTPRCCLEQVSSVQCCRKHMITDKVVESHACIDLHRHRE